MNSSLLGSRAFLIRITPRPMRLREWPPRVSHRTRIVGLVLATVLPVLLLAVFGLWQYLNAAKQAVVDDRVALAESAAVTAQTFLSGVTTSAQTLALSPEFVDPARQGALPNLLDAVRQTNPDWQAIAVFGTQGQPIAASGNPPADTPQLRYLLQQVRTSNHVMISSIENPTRAQVGVPLTFTDNTRGVLLISPSIRLLTTELRAETRGELLDLAIVDRDGTTIVPPPQGATWLNNTEVQSVFGASASGSEQVTTSSGPLLVSFAPVSDTPWLVVIGQPASIAFMSLEREVGVVAAALILTLGVAGLLAWRLGQRLSESYEQMVEARDRAEEAKQARDAVLASVSHDLQNPIAAAKGHLQLVQRRIAAEPQAPASGLARSLQQTERAVARMQQMTEELVDSARLRAGYELALRPALTDLGSLIQQVVDDQLAASNSHQVHVGADGELWVACDPARMSRVVANLLSNAIKYSPTGSQVVVELRKVDDDSGQWAVVSVGDEGIGIPAEDLPHLFERFHRAGNALTHAGTGLGLAGVRSIVLQHGGNITVESHQGVGTTVRLRLPRSGASKQLVGAA
jgi:signal transduction histidine kinase